MNNDNTLEILKSEIREFCCSHGSDDEIKKYARYFKEGYDGYGVHLSLLQPPKDIWQEKYKSLGLAGFLHLGDMLFENGKYEEGALAIHFVKEFLNEFKLDTFEHIGRWLETGVRNWAHTDIICGNLLSVFIRDKIIEFNGFAEWRTAASRWKRRAVPVSLLTFLKEKKINIPELLMFIRLMMHDKERVVHQVLGWFLRETWKLEPAPVEALLLEFRQTAPRLIYQYATEKMSKEEKERFRKPKSASN